MKAESKAIIFGRYNCDESNSSIYLKPLSSISDEDAEALFNMMFEKQHSDNPKEFKIEIGKSWADSYNRTADLFCPFNYIGGYQLLCLKGYATPQTVIEDGKVVTYSVEELVSNGTFKLD